MIILVLHLKLLLVRKVMSKTNNYVYIDKLVQLIEMIRKSIITALSLEFIEIMKVYVVFNVNIVNYL